MITTIKEQYLVVAVAALLGAGGGTGGSMILGHHAHPEIIAEIREMEYEMEIRKLTVEIGAMEMEGVDPQSAKYRVAVTSLEKFTVLKVELSK